MKRYFTLVGIIALASCGSVKQSSMTASFAPNVVVAHRGAFKKNSFPENSIASLKEAIRLQCTGSEFDVWMTADDSLVINHDPHYQKQTIEKTTYSQLATTPLSNGETLPTLRQYLQAGLTDNKQTRLVLEIKPSTVSKERGKLVAERVVKMVEELGAAPVTTYISFDYDILKRIKEINKKAITQYLNGDIAPEQIKADGMEGIDYNLAVFKKKPEWIESAKKHKLILNAWTVNNKEDMQWLLDNKFDFITTNEPELLLEITKGGALTKK